MRRVKSIVCGDEDVSAVHIAVTNSIFRCGGRKGFRLGLPVLGCIGRIHHADTCLNHYYIGPDNELHVWLRGTGGESSYLLTT